MKKILFALVALVTMLFSSCSNDAIEISTEGKKFDITVNVSTQDMYDKFDITDDITEKFLRENKAAIGVFSFLYDKNGKLVTSKNNSNGVFGSITQEFPNIVEGEYTIVTVETLVSVNGEMDNWAFSQKENLSTLAIMQLDPEVYFPYVLGVSSQEFTLSNNRSISITPNPIGSLINVFFYDFNRYTDVENLGFGTHDCIQSYKLNPKLSRNDKFETKLTDNSHFNLRGQTTIDKTTNMEIVTCYVLESSIKYRFGWQDEEKLGTTNWSLAAKDNVTIEGNVNLEDGKNYYAGFTTYQSNWKIGFFQTYDELLRWY